MAISATRASPTPTLSDLNFSNLEFGDLKLGDDFNPDDFYSDQGGQPDIEE